MAIGRTLTKDAKNPPRDWIENGIQKCRQKRFPCGVSSKYVFRNEPLQASWEGYVICQNDSAGISNHIALVQTKAQFFLLLLSFARLSFAAPIQIAYTKLSAAYRFNVAVRFPVRNSCGALVACAPGFDFEGASVARLQSTQCQRCVQTRRCKKEVA